VRGEKKASRRGRIRCRTTPRHYRRTLGRSGSGRHVVGEEEAGHRVVACDARGGSSAPRGCRHRRNRTGLPGAEEEEGLVDGGGRGRGRLGAPRAGRRKREGPADRGRGRRLRLGRGRGAGRVGLGVGCSFYTRVDQG
jgi:hypothetical protein